MTKKDYHNDIEIIDLEPRTKPQKNPRHIRLFLIISTILATISLAILIYPTFQTLWPKPMSSLPTKILST